MTSRYTFDHRLYQNKIDGHFPNEMKTEAECFRDAGYYTTLFSGDWRIVPTYGSARGFDRTVYQHMCFGYRADEVVADIVEQLEAFYDTDQYIWATIGDLHNVADRVPCSISDQLSTDLRDRVDTPIAEGEKSVKIEYSESMSKQYENVLRFIDRKLKYLFQVIEEKFDPKDVVISIFSDHGQGFLIPEGAEFFAEERTNVAFMIKDGTRRGIISDELVSAVDHYPMICSLCDVRFDGVNIEGKVPKIVGGTGREYCLTESLHPGDPYQAVIHFDNGAYHFLHDSIVMPDGRFQKANYTCYIKDASEEKIKCEVINQFTGYMENHIAPMLVY